MNHGVAVRGPSSPLSADVRIRAEAMSAADWPATAPAAAVWSASSLWSGTALSTFDAGTIVEFSCGDDEAGSVTSGGVSASRLRDSSFAGATTCSFTRSDRSMSVDVVARRGMSIAGADAALCWDDGWTVSTGHDVLELSAIT